MKEGEENAATVRGESSGWRRRKREGGSFLDHRQIGRIGGFWEEEEGLRGEAKLIQIGGNWSLFEGKMINTARVAIISYVHCQHYVKRI